MAPAHLRGKPCLPPSFPWGQDSPFRTGVPDHAWLQGQAGVDRRLWGCSVPPHLKGVSSRERECRQGGEPMGVQWEMRQVKFPP